jgi:hypothetical protein
MHAIADFYRTHRLWENVTEREKPKGNPIESAPGIPPCCRINRLGLFVPLPPLLIRLVYEIDCGLRRLVSREREKLMPCTVSSPRRR